jgi:hypothetical protein
VAGTRVPEKPLKVIVSALLGLQVSVAVTVEGAPPGTDAGDRETPAREGEQVAAAFAGADETARAGCAQIITAAIRRETAATTPTVNRRITIPVRSNQPE